MIKNFNFFVNEELRIEKMDLKTLETFKINLLTRLNEYRTYILANIEYNLLTNKIEYKDFDIIDIKVIIRELSNEFSEDVVKELNIETFLLKLNQILELKKRNTKKNIRQEFGSYFNSIEDRIDRINRKYETEGRIQSEDEAKDIDIVLKHLNRFLILLIYL